MKIIDCPQGSPEWLAARCGVPSASRFAAIMATLKSGGEAAERRNYRVDLVIERLTGKPLESFQSAAMKQGTEREPFARMAYEEHSGNIVQEVGFCKHNRLEAGASPDGLIGDDGGLEIKCPERAAHFNYLSLADGAAPPEYIWQIQGGMWITGRAWWDFVSWNPDFPAHLQLVVRRVRRDESAIDKLAAAVELFAREIDAEVTRVSGMKAAA